MVKTDTLEGILNDEYRFHYDLFADVLYVERLYGDIILREESTDRAGRHHRHQFVETFRPRRSAGLH